MKLNQKAIEEISSANLPLYVRWMINNVPLDYDFSIARLGLRSLPDNLIQSGNAEWSNLLIFGECDYAEGGGASPWLCICKKCGSIYGFDLERDKPMFLFNSSVEKFIETFRLLDKYLGNHDDLHLPINCKNQLQDIDAEAFPSSEWQSLVSYLIAIPRFVETNKIHQMFQQRFRG